MNPQKYAGDNNNSVKSTQFDLGDAWIDPHEFEYRVYGPYLIVRTRRPTVRGNRA